MSKTLTPALDVNAALEAVFATDAEPAALGVALEQFFRSVLTTVTDSVASVTAWDGGLPAPYNNFCLNDDGSFAGFLFTETGERVGWHMAETAGKWSVRLGV